MFKWLSLFLFLFSSIQLEGVDLMLQGIHEMSAGCPDLAETHFREHLQQKLSEQERQVTLYNLATALIQQHSYESARKVFLQIEPQYIVSPTVRRAFLTNNALLLLKIAKPETIQEAETVAKELDEPIRSDLLEEAAITKLKVGVRGRTVNQEDLEDTIDRLFEYLQQGGNDPLYFENIRNIVPKSEGSSWDLLTSLLHENFENQVDKEGLKAAFELFLRTEMNENWKVFREEKEWVRNKIEKLLDVMISHMDKSEVGLLKLLKGHMASFSAKEAALYYKLTTISPGLLYQAIWQKDTNLTFAFEILHEKLMMRKNIQAANELQKAEKEWPQMNSFLLSYLAFDQDECLQYELDHFSEEMLPSFQFCWNAVKGKIEPSERVQKIDEAVLLLPKLFSQKEETKVAVLVIEYWLFYNPKTAVKFGVTFEREAKNVGKNDASMARDVTLDILANAKKMKLPSSLVSELNQVEGIVQANSQFEMQRAIHSRILELLEKIAQLSQKEEKTPEQNESQRNEPTPNMPPANLKISSEDAIQLVQEMESLDHDEKVVAQPAGGGKYPW